VPAVLFFHGDHLAGGHLGVDLFFVLYGAYFVGQGAQTVTRMLAPQMGLGDGGRP
jgi:hypothetical protein